ncbi:hypothetical protein LWI28_000006 [Acer negundo]|uniref:Endonuclease/exonuclease/phosphatase domain-containing protein n=1 Tax=Acer negundo TaxID=4023 RepID=A0AAD5J2D9_ACENE|nr:hypothetical protein LWI28_000006 [Acer negundo]
MCHVGEKPTRKEDLRKEREEKVWKEVGQKDSLEKGDELTVVVAQDQRNIGMTKEKEFTGLGVENLQLAVTVEESEIVLNVSTNMVNGKEERYGCFWKDDIELKVVGTSNQCLTVLLSADSGSLLATFVYAKCSHFERRVLWEQLHGISDFNVPWVVLGDFNTIHFDSEKVGGRPHNSLSMAEFNECTSRCGLLDVRFEGRQLSWCNSHQGLTRSWAKLDRVLINNDFIVKYGDAKASC